MTFVFENLFLGFRMRLSEATEDIYVLFLIIFFILRLQRMYMYMYMRIYMYMYIYDFLRICVRGSGCGSLKFLRTGRSGRK